jgi:hypothetical protein
VLKRKGEQRPVFSVLETNLYGRDLEGSHDCNDKEFPPEYSSLNFALPGPDSVRLVTLSSTSITPPIGHTAVEAVVEVPENAQHYCNNETIRDESRLDVDEAIYKEDGTCSTIPAEKPESLGNTPQRKPDILRRVGTLLLSNSTMLAFF